MMYLSQKRSELSELMDQKGTDPLYISKALKELEVINKYLGGYNVLIKGFNEITTYNKNLTVLDIGSGGGDNLRKIADWCRRNRINASFTGLDKNPEMTGFAIEKSKAYPEIEFITADVWDMNNKGEKYDVVMSSLFCHHFNDDILPSLLKVMQRCATKYILINDLERHWFAYHSIKQITKYFSNNPLVKHDAPLSVARSLNQKEWISTLTNIGFKTFEIEWCWAWRYKIIICL